MQKCGKLHLCAKLLHVYPSVTPGFECHFWFLKCHIIDSKANVYLQFTCTVNTGEPQPKANRFSEGNSFTTLSLPLLTVYYEDITYIGQLIQMGGLTFISLVAKRYMQINGRSYSSI